MCNQLCITRSIHNINHNSYNERNRNYYYKFNFNLHTTSVASQNNASSNGVSHLKTVDAGLFYIFNLSDANISHILLFKSALWIINIYMLLNKFIFMSVNDF